MEQQHPHRNWWAERFIRIFKSWFLQRANTHPGTLWFKSISFNFRAKPLDSSILKLDEKVSIYALLVFTIHKCPPYFLAFFSLDCKNFNADSLSYREMQTRCHDLKTPAPCLLTTLPFHLSLVTTTGLAMWPLRTSPRDSPSKSLVQKYQRQLVPWPMSVNPPFSRLFCVSFLSPWQSSDPLQRLGALFCSRLFSKRLEPGLAHSGHSVSAQRYLRRHILVTWVLSHRNGTLVKIFLNTKKIKLPLTSYTYSYFPLQEFYISEIIEKMHSLSVVSWAYCSKCIQPSRELNTSHVCRDPQELLRVSMCEPHCHNTTAIPAWPIRCEYPDI